MERLLKEQTSNAVMSNNRSQSTRKQVLQVIQLSMVNVISMSLPPGMEFSVYSQGTIGQGCVVWLVGIKLVLL